MGFALLPSPKMCSLLGFFESCIDEIETMSVAVALPEDRYEPKNAGPDGVAFGVGT
jgi:hypothetical protein